MSKGQEELRNSKEQALRHLAEAELYYRASLRWDASEAGLHVKLGIVQLMTEQPEQALDHLLRAAELSPSDPQTSLWLGMAYARSGRLSLAAELFKEARSSDQLLSWGNQYYHDGDFETAAIFFRAAVRTPPNQGYAYRRLGAAEEELGNIEEAISAYRSSVELETTDLVQRDIVQAYIYLLEKRWTEAARSYERLLENDAQRPSGLLPLFRKQASRLEGNFQLHFNLGTAYYRLTRLDDAVRELEAAVRLRPDRDKWYYLLLADAYSDQGNLRASLYWYRQVLEVDPTDRHALDRARSLSYVN